VLAGLLAEPAQELFGVFAVQLVEVGDLGWVLVSQCTNRRSASRE
jgi:hypothetical protein